MVRAASSGVIGKGGARRLLGVLLVSFALTSAADQNHPELDALFQDLALAEAAPEAARLENRIWQRWLLAPTEDSQRLIARLESAMRTGDMRSALSLADELVDLVPDFAEAWNKRATIRYLLGDNDGSVDDIRRTLELEPRHFGAISGLGLIFMRQGDKRGALAAFEQVLAISPASQRAQANVDRVTRELGTDI